MILAVDFDGTLMQPTGRPFSNRDMGIPVAGAQQFLARLVRAGDRYFVHSVRANTIEGSHAIEKWLHLHNFPAPTNVVPKPAADVYVDDRGLQFTNWSKAYSDIIRQRGRQ